MKIYILIERHPGENSQIRGCYLSEEEATKFRDDKNNIYECYHKYNKCFFIEEHDIIEP